MYDFDKNGKSVRIKAGEGVMIRWDADPVRGEPESESAKRLLPSTSGIPSSTATARGGLTRDRRLCRDCTFPTHSVENFGCVTCTGVRVRARMMTQRRL